MHLVDEEHRLLAAGRELAAGHVDRGADLLDAGGDRRDLDEPAIGLLGAIAAIVVFPVPGGPHSSSDIDWSPSISWRSGAPSARSCA